MNIIVCAKQVPDTNEVKIDLETKNLIREGAPSILNPYDEYGVEEALRIREKNGGRITVLSMGPPQASDALDYCVSMGVDEAILLTDQALGGSDTLATGYALARVISGRKFDLIICGAEAIDGATGQVGPIIAENLGIPQFTYVKKVEIIDPKKIRVYREAFGGVEVLEVKLPALICVVKDINEPRLPKLQTGKKIMYLNAQEAGLDEEKIGINGSPTKVINISFSNRAKSYVLIDSNLPVWERIKAIINGGMVNKSNAILWRGSSEEIAKRLVLDITFKKYCFSDSFIEDHQ